MLLLGVAAVICRLYKYHEGGGSKGGYIPSYTRGRGMFPRCLEQLLASLLSHPRLKMSLLMIDKVPRYRAFGKFVPNGRRLYMASYIPKSGGRVYTGPNHISIGNPSKLTRETELDCASMCHFLLVGDYPSQILDRRRAPPTLDDKIRMVPERLPCFVTRIPAPAATMEAGVEMFQVFLPSPPVPTISAHLEMFRELLLSRMVRMNKPSTSSVITER